MNTPAPLSRKSRGLQRLLLAAAAAAIALLFVPAAGCGGGAGGAGSGSASLSKATGRATVTITWPGRAASSRLIPIAANSITVSFLDSFQTSIASQTVARPATGNSTTLTFPALSVGPLTLKAQAFPTSDGTGTAQAGASKSVTITAGTTTALAITMASTINSIAIAPTAPTVSVGSTVTLTAAATDASGAAVLISPSTISWASSNTQIATVTSTGIVTGIVVGTATLTVTESESGKSASVLVTVTTSGTVNIVDLATTYINSLSSAQQAATVVGSSQAAAARWSGAPAAPGSSGTNSLRNGVAYSALTVTQQTAWLNLVQYALSTQGNTQFTQIRASDNYLGTLSSGYSGNYEYVGFVGTPSLSGTWLLQLGGHNIAHNYYYSGTTLQTATPYYLGVEPQSFTYAGSAYTPLSAQSNAMFNLINSLTSAQLTNAKLTGSFSDVLLGPGLDARSNFPTGTTNRGTLATNLTSAQRSLLTSAMAAWTQNSPLSSTIQSLYVGELDETYVAYSGTTTFTNAGDYVRIDGPHVWIEFICVPGAVVSGQLALHTVWRDRVSDYNGAYGF